MKKAFSIIEIIIAIMVIALGVSAIPYIINSNSNSNQGALLQEAITSNKTKLLDIMSFPWNSIVEGETQKIPIFIISGINDDYNKSNYFANPRNIAQASLNPLKNEIIKGGINDFAGDNGSIIVTDANKSKNILSLKYKVSMGYLSKPQNDLRDNKNRDEINTVFANELNNPVTIPSIALMIKINSNTTNLDKNKNVSLVGYSFDIGEPKYDYKVLK